MKIARIIPVTTQDSISFTFCAGRKGKGKVLAKFSGENNYSSREEIYKSIREWKDANPNIKLLEAWE